MREWKERFSFQVWLISRLVRTGGRFLSVTTFFSFIGMVLGVASLVISMSVMSGFESTLKSAVIDVIGHVILTKSGSPIRDVDKIEEKVHELKSEALTSKYIQLEGILARKGKTSGVLLQGIDLNTIDQVLNLRSRLVSGEFLSPHKEGIDDEVAPALVGKALFKNYAMNLGDQFQIVIPKPSRTQEAGFIPKLQKFKIIGVIDLGKYEYDSRYILTTFDVAQDLVGFKDAYSGIKIRLPDENEAEEFALSLAAQLGYPYGAREWYDMSRNLFEAVKLEKVVIFVVLLCMVLIASFNICSTLFVNVLKRFSDISILKTIGASPRFLMWLFCMHGLIIGFLGSVCGIILGVILSHILTRSVIFNIPAEVYKLDHLNVEIRFMDLGLILLASIVVCFLASLAPAWRGARLNPVEGLRYE